MPTSILTRQHEARGLWDGTVTLLVRPVTPQPTHEGNGWYEWGYLIGAPKATSPKRAIWHAETWQNEQGTAPIDRYAPYHVGQVVAVKETWASISKHPKDRIAYRANMMSYGNAHAIDLLTGDTEANVKMYPDPVHPGQVKRWRPSTTMPDWAVRTHLRVLSVAVKRLHDLTTEQILDAGLFDRMWSMVDGNVRRIAAGTWDRIYGKGTYAANPWVWLYGVEKVTP